MPVTVFDELSSQGAQSKAALVKFMDRLAEAFAIALHKAGVDFHSVQDNERTIALGEDGFTGIAQLKLRTNASGEWRYAVGSGIYDIPFGETRIPSITLITRSELEQIADAWAGEIAKRSKQVVFGDLYTPSATLDSLRFHNAHVAFRHVRFWDAMNSYMGVRFDVLFKALDV